MADISAKKYFTLIPDVTAPPSFPPEFEDPQDPLNPPGVGGISLYKQLGDVSDSDFIGKNGFVPVVTGENLLTLQPLPNFNIDGLISGGVVQWTGVGYIFNVSSAVARFLGQIINSSPDLLTLTTADGTNPRIDLFILQVLFDGNGVPIGMEADFITGTPASTPVKPQIDPATQIELTQILVPALSTVPTLTDELIYAENVEWTGSSSGSGTVNFASTNAPFSGSVSIETTNVQNNSRTILTRSANFDLSTVQTLGFQIRLKATLGGSQNIGVSFLNSSGNQITNEINIPVDKSLINAYQFIGIDLNQFTFSTSNKEVRAIQFRFQRATGSVTYSGYFLDVIKLEGGINTPVQFGSFLSLTDTPSSYAGQGGKVVKVKSDESGLEFGTGGGGASTFLDLTDTPSSYSGQGLKAVRVNSGATGLEFVDFPSSGVQSVTGDGVDNTDPDNPVLSFPSPSDIGANVDLGEDINDALTSANTPDAGNPFATMADVGGGGGRDDDAVHYDAADGKNATEKQQARDNIGSNAGIPQNVTTDAGINNLARTSNLIIFTGGTVSRDLAGVVAGLEGEVITIVNYRSFNVVVKNQAGTSTAANRFSIGSDFILSPNKRVDFAYSETLSRWIFSTPADLFLRKDVTDTAVGPINITGGISSGGATAPATGSRLKGSSTVGTVNHEFQDGNGQPTLQLFGNGTVRSYTPAGVLILEWNNVGVLIHSKSTNANTSVRRDELYINWVLNNTTSGVLNDVSTNSGLSGVLRCTNATEITGAVGVQGQRLTIYNENGSSTLTIRDSSASSALANRFEIGGDLVIPIRQAAEFIYMQSRWRKINQ